MLRHACNVSTRKHAQDSERKGKEVPQRDSGSQRHKFPQCFSKISLGPQRCHSSYMETQQASNNTLGHGYKSTIRYYTRRRGWQGHLASLQPLLLPFTRPHQPPLVETRHACEEVDQDDREGVQPEDDQSIEQCMYLPTGTSKWRQSRAMRCGSTLQCREY